MSTLDPGAPARRIDRRHFVGTALGGAAGLALLASCTDEGASATTGTTLAGPATVPAGADLAFGQGPTAFQLFADEGMNFQALFALGSAGRNAEVGEVVTVVDAVNADGAPGGSGSMPALYAAMLDMGDRLRRQADEARAAGRLVTARNRYLRAAQYVNQALFFVLASPTPEREEDVYLAMNDAFTQAASLMQPAWEPIDIPYEGETLPAWFLKPLGASGPRPTVIINNGSDGQNVDLWSYGAEAALARGWNAVLLEGPGQGQVLFVRQQPIRPDWEAVITPVVDHLLTRADVDPDRIALTGWSEGGYLVTRAAAFEERLAAVVADPGCVDVYVAFPEALREVADAGSEQQVNQEWNELIVPGATPEQRYELKKRLELYSPEALRQARAGQVPSDWYGLSRYIQQFQNRDVIGQIRVPMLVIDYEDEQFYPGQAEELFERLTAPKDYVRLTAEYGSQYHCAPMAPERRNEVVFDWLDDTIGR